MTATNIEVLRGLLDDIGLAIQTAEGISTEMSIDEMCVALGGTASSNSDLASKLDALGFAVQGYASVSTSMTLAEMAVAIANAGPSFDPSTVTWANSSWSDIATMLQMHYAGQLDIHDYWNVGDTRTVSLAAMSATGVGESHVAQDVELVLMSADHYDMSDDSGKAAFVWGCKNLLASTSANEYGYMNSSQSNYRWKDCPRRTWCNSVFKNSIPNEFQALLKQVKIKSGDISTGSSSLVDDYIFFPAEKEIFGINSAASSTSESTLAQYGWYEVDANKKKYGFDDVARGWWTRSAASGLSDGFCYVKNDNTSVSAASYSNLSIVPHGCI